MEWHIVATDDFPENNQKVLGICQTIVDENTDLEYHWEGIVQVYFTRNRGWKRCETDKPIFVEMWTPLPGKYENGNFFPNNGV